MKAATKQQLIKLLSDFPSVTTAIVFGSIADGRETAQSDLDIAIKADHKMDSELKISLIEALARSTGRSIDLIDLRTAGQPLLGEIIETGTRILGSNDEFASLVMKNLLDRADFLPYRERILKYRRETWLAR